MEIKDLQPRQGNVDLVLRIDEKGQMREFSKFGKAGKVCDCVASDKTGKIKLTLWNEQADLVFEGDTIKIENGYVGEWQGEKQLSTGKFGSISVIEKAGTKTGNAAAPDASKEGLPAVDRDVPEEQIE
jgi:replication factor A1